MLQVRAPPPKKVVFSQHLRLSFFFFLFFTVEFGPATDFLVDVLPAIVTVRLHDANDHPR